MTSLMEDLREQRSHSSTEKNNIISRVDRPLKRSLVPIQPTQHRLKECRWTIVVRRGVFAIAVELEKLGEEREDECKGDLVKFQSAKLKCSFCWEILTRSRRSEMAMTLRTFFLATGSRPAIVATMKLSKGKQQKYNSVNKHELKGKRTIKKKKTNPGESSKRAPSHQVKLTNQTRIPTLCEAPSQPCGLFGRMSSGPSPTTASRRSKSLIPCPPVPVSAAR